MAQKKGRKQILRIQGTHPQVLRDCSQSLVPPTRREPMPTNSLRRRSTLPRM